MGRWWVSAGEPESWGCGAGTGVCWGKKEIGWHYLQPMRHYLPNRPLKMELKAWGIYLESWGEESEVGGKYAVKSTL